MSQDKEGMEPKPELPQVFVDLADKAIRAHQRRQATPELQIANKDGRWWVDSPYRDQDEDRWTALLFDAFGTRSGAAFDVFICQLAALCSVEWNDRTKAWHPNEQELIAAIQILRSVKPRNEAEACLAAQMVAVHLMQMKLAAQVMKRDWPDPRASAIAGKLARTYVIQLDAMTRLKGRGSRQRITVRKHSKHEHKHIHLHQGGNENGNQPHGPRRSRDAEINSIDQLGESQALPSPDPMWGCLPMPGREGEEPLPATRRRSKGGSSDR